MDAHVLATAAADCARILPNRPVTPVLAGLRVEAHDDHLTVAAFDYDRSLVVTIPADVGTPGVVLLPGRALAGLVANLDSDVDLSDDGNRATLAAGRSRITLPLGAVEDYPALPEVGESATITVDADHLADALSEVAHSVADQHDPTKPLTGVQIAVSDGVLTMASTDRHVVSVRRLSVHAIEDVEALVSPRELADALRGATGVLRIGLDEHQVGVRGDGRVATMRPIAGEFPPWARLLPEPSTTVLVDRDALVGAAAMCQRADERPRPIVMTIDADGITYEGGERNDADGNKVNGYVAADLTGDGMTLAINPALLTNCLKSFPAGVVRLGLTKPLRPVLIEQDGTNGLHLIQPIRLP